MLRLQGILAACSAQCASLSTTYSTASARVLSTRQYGASSQEDVRLVWPPPSSSAHLRGLPHTEDLTHRQEGSDAGRDREEAAEQPMRDEQSLADLQNKSDSLSSTQLSAASLPDAIRQRLLRMPQHSRGDSNDEPQATEGARQLAVRTSPAPSFSGERTKAMSDAFREHGINAPSFAKANLRKLPAKVLGDMLEAWGHGGRQILKPQLVELAHEALQKEGSAPATAPLRQAPASTAETSRDAGIEVTGLEHISPDQVAAWLVDAHTNAVSVMDVRSKCEFAEHIILATGRSAQHVHAAAAAVRWQVGQHCPALDGRLPHLEGDEKSDWVAVDVGQIIVHVQTEQARETYGIQELWEGTRGAPLTAAGVV